MVKMQYRMPRVNWEFPNSFQLLTYIMISGKWPWTRSPSPKVHLEFQMEYITATSCSLGW